MDIKRFAISICLVLFPPVLAAQNVVVLAPSAGPGVDATTLPSAIALAADGDIVLIKAGTYSNGGSPNETVISAKSITLVADNGAAVTLQDRLRIQSIGVNQRVAVRGIKVQYPLLTGGTPALDVSNCLGTLWFEDCEFNLTLLLPSGTGAGVAVRATSCAALLFARCSIQGASSGGTTVQSGADGYVGTQSSAAFYECTVKGGTPMAVEGNGGSGATLNGGLLFASGSTFGGSGGPGDTFFKCPGDGGDGIHLATGAPALVSLALTAVGGSASPSSAFCFGPGADGVPGQGVRVTSGVHSALSGTARTFHVNPTAREGGTIIKSYGAPAGDFAYRSYSGFSGFTYFLAYKGVLGLSLGAPINTKFDGLMPASGTLAVPSTIGPLAGTVEGVTLFLQGSFYSASSGILLGTPSFTVLLDSSL